MEITGKIIKVFPIQTGVSQRTGNAWARQSYVLETEGQYVRHCAFDVIGTERIQNMGINEGEVLTVFFDVDAREWQGKWYNSITAFRVDRGAQGATAQTQGQQPMTAQPYSQTAQPMQNMAPQQAYAQQAARPVAPSPPPVVSSPTDVDDSNLPF